jgi:hypothetical protein
MAAPLPAFVSTSNIVVVATCMHLHTQTISSFEDINAFSQTDTMYRVGEILQLNGASTVQSTSAHLIKQRNS